MVSGCLRPRRDIPLHSAIIPHMPTESNRAYIPTAFWLACGYSAESIRHKQSLMRSRLVGAADLALTASETALYQQTGPILYMYHTCRQAIAGTGVGRCN